MKNNHRVGRQPMLIENARQVLTMRGENNDDVCVLRDASIYIEEGIIRDVGPAQEVRAAIPNPEQTSVIDARERVVTPGFVDSHTHVVFGGSRVQEYAVKLTDDDPDTLRRLGIPTGIYASVNRTKSLPVEVLAQQTEARMRQMILNGTTTLESKSGYGLNLPAEMKMLEVNRLMSGLLPIDIVPCFLGGHGWEEGSDKDRYVERMVEEYIPQVAQFHMAALNDVWVDEGHFTAEDAYKILEAGKRYGLIPTIHAGAYSYIGGEDVAIELGAASIGHLNYTPHSLFPLMKEKGIVGQALVSTDFVVRHAQPVNIRAMLESGMTVALATNCNPGNWQVSMPMVMQLATRLHGISAAEAFRAATYGGARALTLTDRGRIDRGYVADLLLLNVDTYEDMVYRLGGNMIASVIKNGKIIVQDGMIQ